MLLAPYVVWVAPAGLLAWKAWNAPTHRLLGAWIGLMVAWVLAVSVLAELALRAGLDTFTISLVAFCLGMTGLLIWVVLRQRTARRRIVWVIVLAAWVATSVPFTWVFGGPYLTFELATIQCGRQPAVATNFAAVSRYSLPGDQDYGPSMFSNTYYCSAGDAEAAGYRRR